MSLPRVRVSGSPAAQGQRHGRELRDRIATNLEVYFARFRDEGGLDRAEVLRRARAYEPVMAEVCPDYHADMLGVARGGGFEPLDIVALNVRYEILYDQSHSSPGRDGCTAFAVLSDRTDCGHVLMGQNWDWIPEVRGALLEVRDPDGTARVGFTEAGIVGSKIGVNDAGLGLCINGLHATGDDWTRLGMPFHVQCYEVLRARSLEDAARVLTGARRSCSANHLIAHASGSAIDVETGPVTDRVLTPRDGCLTHTNHFLDPEALDVVEPPEETVTCTHERLARFRELMAGQRDLSVERLQGFLRDHDGHPGSICRHPDDRVPVAARYATVTSVIMDLTERALHLTDGTPCEASYTTVTLPRG